MGFITEDYSIENDKTAHKCNIIALSFKKYLDFLEQIQKDTTTSPEKSTDKPLYDFEKVFSEIRSSENKFWKGLPMEKVICHFEIMTIRKNKNGVVYLTKEQLASFLKKGFLNDAIQPIQKINCSNGEKGFVIKRFYDFFNIAVSQYGYPQKKEKFIKLFTDCFDNWEQNTIAPFFKSNKTKDKW